MSESGEEIRYGMLGRDDLSSAEKLAKYRGEVSWSYLKPHFESGVLFFVDEHLQLENVGAALGADESDLVKSWLKAGDLVKIGSLHAAQWEKGFQTFEALVVSPFVLCQLVR